MADPTDAQLLRGCRREPEAFAVVYDRHASGLLSWVRSRCGDDEVALDVVQETFARALKEAHSFRGRGDGSALPWLRTIARNLVHDWRRRGIVENRARRALGLLVPLEEQPGLRRELAGALARLPAEQRVAVQARLVLGAEYAEIAAANGISEANARARVSRGLRSLRALLRGGSR